MPGEVHFELDAVIQPVQCAHSHVLVTMQTAVMVQLDKYEAEGYIAPVTEPTDWISNMVIVKKSDKLWLCIDPMGG